MHFIDIPSRELYLLETLYENKRRAPFNIDYDLISLVAETKSEMKDKIGKTNISEGSILKFSKLSDKYRLLIYPTVYSYLKAGEGKEHFHINGINTTPVHLFDQWLFIYEGVKIDGIMPGTKPMVNPCFLYNKNNAIDGARGLITANDLESIRENHPACNTLYHLLNEHMVTSVSAHSNGTFLSIVAMLIADKNKVENIPYYPFAPAFDDKILKKFKTLGKVLNTKSTLFMNVNDFLNKTLLDKPEEWLEKLLGNEVDIDLDRIVINTIGVTKKGGLVGFAVGTLIQASIGVHIEITKNTEATLKQWKDMNLKNFILVDNCKDSFGTHHGLLTHYVPAILSVFYKIELSPGKHTVQVSSDPESQLA